MTRPRALFVGIDLGTSGVRATALDQRGHAHASVARPWPHGTTTDPGVWGRTTLDLLGRLLSRIDRGRVCAIAVDGTSGTVMLCGTCGTPRGSALNYDDNRAQAEAEAVAAVAPSSIAGGSHGGPAKILWLMRHRQAAARALPQAAFISGCLSGRFDVCDEHNALKLGADGHRWAPWLQTLGVRALLPRLVPAGTIVGSLRPTLRRRFKLRQAPWIVAGTTDSTAGILALGSLPAGTAITTLGSTLVLKIVSHTRVEIPSLGVYSHSLGHAWLVGGASNSGGRVLKHFFTRQQLLRLSAQLPQVENTGLNYYPLLTPGERFPVADPRWPPKLAPRPDNDAIFLQGLLEGLTAIEQLGYQTLVAHGAPRPVRVVTTGKGAGNAAWRVIRARALGVPIESTHLSAAAGSAQLARRALATRHPQNRCMEARIYPWRR